MGFELDVTPRPSHGRRSKLDIVGDILRVVSAGAERPTNIMFRANLTWPLTVAYVETLVRHEMLRADVVGSKVGYHVTPKGTALLRSFLQTEEAAAELELERIDSSIFAKVSGRRGKAKSEGAPTPLDALRASLQKEGYRAVQGSRQGLSGVDHPFDLVASDEIGGKVGYIVSETGSVGDVIRAFILQTDCEFPVRVYCLGPPEAQAKELAASYNITLITAVDPEAVR